MVEIDLNERLDAIIQLAQIADVDYKVEDGEITIWSKGNKPTEEEIQSKIDSVAYIRNRKVEYPDWSIQLEKIYDDGIDKWKTEMVDPVKAKYPKP